MTLHPELNLDGLPGPTHGFAGLSHGNLASTGSRAQTSNPRAAALQALEKMKLVASLGVPQGVLPPQPRPDVASLRRLGFTGSDAAVIEHVSKHHPSLLLAVCSSSAMWAANAATVSPSADSVDGQVHVTPANLLTQFHRSLETEHTAALLRLILPFAVHHQALAPHVTLSDEGAANHIRLGLAGPGRQLFVHGPAGETTFPARQTQAASEALARLNKVRHAHLLAQAPAAVDAGAFHNDVVSVGSGDVLLMHEDAFELPPEAIADALPEVQILVARRDELSLDEAVSTYLFNSQLVPLANGELAMIAPVEVQEHPHARDLAERFVRAGSRLRHIHYVNLRQSMRNGGGPACLRLRIPLTSAELSRVHPGVQLTPQRLAALEACILRHYREELAIEDLCDPKLAEESREATSEIRLILGLPALSA